MMPVEDRNGPVRHFLLMLRRRWTWIAGSLVLFGGLAAAFLLTTPTQYQATTQLFVSSGATGADPISTVYQGDLYVQERVRSYTAVIDSPSVLQPVVNTLDIDASPSSLAGQISASNPPGTTLIEVTATSGEAETAARLANTASAELARAIVELEARPGQAVDPVKVSVINPADLPTSPSSPPGPVTVGLLGAIVGLVVGVLLVTLREALDTTISSESDLAAADAPPLLAQVPYDSSTSKNPLVVDIAPHSARAEAYRALRTNLRFTGIDTQVRVVVVTSAMPGDGKSTTAANVALALSQTGQKVLLLEGDLRNPRLSAMFGMADGPGLTDVLLESISLDEVLREVPRTSLTLLPAGRTPPNPSEMLASMHMAKLLEDLRADYESVIIDSPPLLAVTDAAILSERADGTVLVVRRGKTTRELLQRARDAVEAVDGRILGVVLTMTRLPRAVRKPYAPYPAEATRRGRPRARGSTQPAA